MAVYVLPALVATHELPCQCLYVLPGRGDGPPLVGRCRRLHLPTRWWGTTFAATPGRLGSAAASARTTGSGGLSAGADPWDAQIGLGVMVLLRSSDTSAFCVGKCPAMTASPEAVKARAHNDRFGPAYADLLKAARPAPNGARRALSGTSQSLSVMRPVVGGCPACRERSRPALNDRAHALTACAPPFAAVRDVSDQDRRSG